jgi:hypothetical protein
MLEIAQRWQLWDCKIEFHCECGRASCHEMAALLPLEYSHARRWADAYLLAPRHQGTHDEVIEQLGERAVVAGARWTTASDRMDTAEVVGASIETKPRGASRSFRGEHVTSFLRSSRRWGRH